MRSEPAQTLGISGAIPLLKMAESLGNQTESDQPVTQGRIRRGLWPAQEYSVASCDWNQERKKGGPRP